MTTDTLGPLERGILMVLNNEQETQAWAMSIVECSWVEFLDWKADFAKDIGYEPGIKEPVTFVSDNLQSQIMDRLYDLTEDADSLIKEIVGDLRTVIDWDAIAKDLIEDYTDLVDQGD